MGFEIGDLSEKQMLENLRRIVTSQYFGDYKLDQDSGSYSPGIIGFCLESERFSLKCGSTFFEEEVPLSQLSLGLDGIIERFIVSEDSLNRISLNLITPRSIREKFGIQEFTYEDSEHSMNIGMNIDMHGKYPYERDLSPILSWPNDKIFETKYGEDCVMNNPKAEKEMKRCDAAFIKWHNEVHEELKKVLPHFFRL